MSALWINAFKVAFVLGLYLFLWQVTRAVRTHLSDQPARRASGDPATITESRIIAITTGADGSVRHIEVRKPLVVGRGAVDVVIDDPFASDRHLRLSFDSGSLLVEDLGSTNGTLVNDRPIDTPTALTRGDNIRVGTTTLEVR
jgi:pSer/pThr/pTyr-binding forkhead associated (FHA) protein